MGSRSEQSCPNGSLLKLCMQHESSPALKWEWLELKVMGDYQRQLLAHQELRPGASSKSLRAGGNTQED